MLSPVNGIAPAERFVYVDLNCDDQAAMTEFGRHFKVDGQALPFVVIANFEGKQVVARCGYGTPTDYQRLILEAEAKPAR